MKLSQLMNQPILNDVEIADIQTDSRLVKRGDLFVAYVGESQDGRDYVEQAIDNGAAAVLYEENSHKNSRDKSRLVLARLQNGVVPCIPVENLKQKLSAIASCFYHHPSERLHVIGVTGTNGKTSVVHFLAQAFSFLGFKCGILSTIGNGMYPDLTESKNTTEGAVEMQKQLAHFAEADCQYVVMEVSSHGLEQHRVDHVLFETAVFTNLSRDHLDYHGNMENYGRAKEKLFQINNLKNAVINAEDNFGKILIQKYQNKLNVLPFFVQKIKKHPHLIGKFNFSNLLAVENVLRAYHFPAEKINAALLQLKPPAGRLQKISIKNKPLVVVDYAHTPDALEKVLQTLKEICIGKLWCVFGCGGDRDKGKRPIMAKVSENEAD